MGRGMRNDVFVGNIAFGTTDEDIRRIFSEVGRVLGVRMAVNAETGKPRATASSSQLRVNFSNNSALVDYAASRREGGGEPRAKATPRQLVEGLSARSGAVSEAKALATEGDGERLAALLGSSGALTDALVHALLQLGMIRRTLAASAAAPAPTAAAASPRARRRRRPSRPPPPRRPWTSSTRR
ncbi:hypothetical protein JL722_2267 [Aureococcus anophagefferens]|nr:hypothetical protein JL722_2267 [Aureococcus anophagefferens]